MENINQKTTARLSECRGKMLMERKREYKSLSARKNRINKAGTGFVLGKKKK